jgi:hypothetical protein
MSCPHDFWERDAAIADGYCPLCAASELALERRRLATSEELRTGLVAELTRLRDAMEVAKTLIGAINDTAPEAVKASNINQAWHVLDDNLRPVTRD